MDKLLRTRLLRQYERFLSKVRDNVEDCDPNTMSTEEITVALEELSVMVPALKKFWDEKLKENEL